MTLKWACALVSATALGVFGTANLIAGLVPGAAVPLAINLTLVALCAAGAVLVVVAEVYLRIDARLSVVSDFLVTRLDEIVARLDDLEGARVADSSTVVPLAPRAARARRED